ncbi:hypothetical protein [Polyangium aurulentum]|uniref:hypothetical protein n=1 Tax=Polyangium aurulentum TaxID=2567896 RepID=UPI0010AE2554|nr:hypothetical protein [Polyangium aurulentum]UQA58217.1 hypothetical protein E8A73_044370 [Polyangium aurulentum]
MADEADERFEELASGLLAPLVLGGKITLSRPFGRLGLTLGEGRQISDVDLDSRVEVARVRRARLIAPVDTLPDLEASDWAIAAALNDLLQATNHELGGMLTMSRYPKLLRSVHEVCELIPRPRDVGSALARHATFGRVMELGRTDTSVSWWTGSAKFRGQPPPTRLLRWRELRRVQVDTHRVPLVEMGEGMPPNVADGFLRALGAWLGCTPLTDLATSTRSSPPFAWSPGTIALIATRPGRTLAFRVLARHALEAVRAALGRATGALPPELGAYRPLVEEFCKEATAGLEALNDSAPTGRKPPASRSSSST